jgi:hypothetical protein
MDGRGRHPAKAASKSDSAHGSDPEARQGFDDRRDRARMSHGMLEDLGNIGDFVGGIGVIATLIYLAIQIRQNTRAVRTASRQEIVAGARDWNRLLVDPEVADAFSGGHAGYPQMEAAAANRYRAVMHDLALFMQGAFALWESGALEDDTYHAYLEFFASQISTPGGAAWWSNARTIYLDRMVANIEARLARGGVPKTIERMLATPSSPG